MLGWASRRKKREEKMQARMKEAVEKRKQEIIAQSGIYMQTDKVYEMGSSYPKRIGDWNAWVEEDYDEHHTPEELEKRFQDALTSTEVCCKGEFRFTDDRCRYDGEKHYFCAHCGAIQDWCAGLEMWEEGDSL